MKKRFKSRKRRKVWIIKWALLLLLVLFINQKLIKLYPLNKVIEKQQINFKINPATFLLSYGLNYKNINNIKEDENTKETFKEIPVTNVSLVKPIIYIYNTHQTEEYKDYDIYKASEYLKANLEKKDIEVILESTNIKEELNRQNLKYKDSYTITRKLLTNNINDKVSLYIDLHRDSSNHKTTTTTYKDKKTARIMFVIGGKHDNYKENYKVVDHLNKMVKNYDKNLTRGIYVRKNSSFNQDLNSKVLLIELGGVENTKEEVNNAIEYLADIISNYVKE